MDIQRLRNLTTTRIHTTIADAHEDLEYITGRDCHGIPAIVPSIKPWLREKVQDTRFWDGEYDPTHVGFFNLPPMTENERMQLFSKMPDPRRQTPSMDNCDKTLVSIRKHPGIRQGQLLRAIRIPTKELKECVEWLVGTGEITREGIATRGGNTTIYHAVESL